jgi:hypothetical protein
LKYRNRGGMRGGFDPGTTRVKPVFEEAKANGNGEVHWSDKRIAEALEALNRSAGSASPILSYCYRTGKILQVRKETYKLL